MKFLDLATRDERLKGVVVKMEGLPGVGWGTAEELRQALLQAARRRARRSWW